jgi:hypothetical protein
MRFSSNARGTGSILGGTVGAVAMAIDERAFSLIRKQSRGYSAQRLERLNGVSLGV